MVINWSNLNLGTLALIKINKTEIKIIFKPKLILLTNSNNMG